MNNPIQHASTTTLYYVYYYALCILLAPTQKKMHQGQWLNIKFGFPQTGKGSQKNFEFGWQTAWEIRFIDIFTTEEIFF